MRAIVLRRRGTGMGSVRRLAWSIGLTFVGAVLIFVVFPPCLDATRGIVSVYLWSDSEKTLYLIEYKAVIEAQSVVERRLTCVRRSCTVDTYGFTECAVFDRRNWRCRRSDVQYLMQDGDLHPSTADRHRVRSGSDQPRDVSRLRWWCRRLSMFFSSVLIA